MRGFAVVEYETAEQAEAVLLEMDRHLIQGQEIRLSLCSPGTSGRSTLAALIAAQGVVSNTPVHIHIYTEAVLNMVAFVITTDFWQIILSDQISALCSLFLHWDEGAVQHGEVSSVI